MMTVESFEENLKLNNERCDALITEMLSLGKEIENDKDVNATAEISETAKSFLKTGNTEDTEHFSETESMTENVKTSVEYRTKFIILKDLLYRYLLHKFMLFDLLDDLSKTEETDFPEEKSSRQICSGTPAYSATESSDSSEIGNVSKNSINREAENRTEDILELAQQSVESIAQLQKGGLKFKDHSGTCGSVSSAVTKKILFLIALQKALGITFEKHEAADIETVTQLTEHVADHLKQKLIQCMETTDAKSRQSISDKKEKVCKKDHTSAEENQMSELTLRQNRLVDEINHLGDSLEQYSYLVFRSGQIEPLPECYKTDANRVKGCQSVVWMVLSVENGVMHFQADSDTLLMKGVLAILMDLVDGTAAEDVCQTEIDIFERTQLAVAFRSDRLAGIQSILNMIRKVACESFRS